MNTVLVTGATGFVGCALVKHLLTEGWQVTAAVRDIRKTLELPQGIKVVNIGDLNESTNWTDAVKGINVVVHLAARVHVMKEHEIDSLAAFRRVNVAGTENLLHSCIKSQVRRFVFLSSIGVNGCNSGMRPFTEDSVSKPHNYYARSKHEAETLIQAIAGKEGLEYVIIRAPLIYGPGDPGNFPRLLKIAKGGIPLPFASVNNKRSFIFRDNLVDALMVAMRDARSVNHLYLVSDAEDISTAELIRRLRSKLGMNARLFPCPLSLMEILGRLTGNSRTIEQLTGSLQVDCGKIRKHLGWTPPHTLESGLEQTINWYSSR